jgi:GTP-binding protein HflX
VPELAARGSAVERDEYGNISRVFLSARTGQGLDTLRAAIAEIATSEHLPDSGRAQPGETPEAHGQDSDASASSDARTWRSDLH